MSKVCPACAGEGSYPIIGTMGEMLLEIECPYCFGSGVAPDEDEEEKEDPSLPPASTAALLTTPEQVREHISKHWSGQP